MINPYAQAFMIAARVDSNPAPHLRETPKPSARRPRLFRMARRIDPTKL